MANDSGLDLERFGVAFGMRTVLDDVTLSLPTRGISLLVGPVASGKSTLLRTLAGLNHAQPELRLRGRACWRGAPLFAPAGEEIRAPRVSFVMQKARFFVDSVRENLVSALPNRSSLDRAAQNSLARHLLVVGGLGHLGNQLDLEVVDLSTAVQRLLAIVRAVASDPDILLADEPTAGIEGEPADAILSTLRAEAARRSVVLVTHNQHHARQAGGTTYLLVDGKLEETAPTEAFFRAPATPSGRDFVRTGRCGPSREGAVEDVPLVSAVFDKSTRSPRGFFWLVPHEVGGLPRPGILGDLDQDLHGLSGLGVRVLVGLEEVATVPLDRLAWHGLEFLHLPTRDMAAPDIGLALALCRDIEILVGQGKAVAFHCRAGLGRTGTMLACQLVWRGRSVAQAIETVRGINPLYIQSPSQVEFIRDFEIRRQAA